MPNAELMRKPHVLNNKIRTTADARLADKEWLRYSQRIAMMMLDKMEELGMTQKSVAERMGCSQQYISRVLKGSENLWITSKSVWKT